MIQLLLLLMLFLSNIISSDNNAQPIVDPIRITSEDFKVNINGSFTDVTTFDEPPLNEIKIVSEVDIGMTEEYFHIVSYDLGDLHIYTDGRFGEIFSILINETFRGIKLGDTQNDIIKVYGISNKEYQIESNKYLEYIEQKSGKILKFEIDKSKVTQIEIKININNESISG